VSVLQQSQCNFLKIYSNAINSLKVFVKNPYMSLTMGHHQATLYCTLLHSTYRYLVVGLLGYVGEGTYFTNEWNKTSRNLKTMFNVQNNVMFPRWSRYL
jgi:hypothetical protein